jgi:hypothetical protein
VLEATRPAVIAARGIDELHGDAQPIASPAHAPLHYRGDCQLPPDFTHVHAGIAKSERAAAAGNAQSGHAIERIDQLLRHTLAEGALVALRSHVGEWQYRDRRKVRADLVRHRRDETVAVAVPRLDVTWLPCLVGQRLAQLLNARGERIVADHDAVPDRGEQIVPAHRLAGALQQPSTSADFRVSRISPCAAQSRPLTGSNEYPPNRTRRPVTLDMARLPGWNWYSFYNSIE